MTDPIPKLSLGPILYYWDRDTVFDFYEKIANTPVDIVYLGETVCSKRRIIREYDWLDIARELTKAGKEVVLSSMTLIEASSELSKLQKLCANDLYTVEANDMAAVNLLSGKTFVSGPAINIYNHHSLSFLIKQGLKRWVLPVELGRQELSDILMNIDEDIETEVFAYGRLPLAYSARCFTARSHNLAKDDCQYRCLDNPDGLLLSTREDEQFLVLNGIQTQSAKTCNLLGDIDDEIKPDIDVLRISPQSHHTPELINIYYDYLHGQLALSTAEEKLKSLVLTGSCNGYWHGDAGMNTTVLQNLNPSI